MRAWAAVGVGVLGFAFGACEDPQVELAALAAENACSVVDDCCVVIDKCNADAWIVTSNEFTEALAWAEKGQNDFCLDCLLPTVTVDCVQGACVARAFSPVDVNLDPEQALSSCGVRDLVNSGSQDIRYVEITDGQVVCGDI